MLRIRKTIGIAACLFCAVALIAATACEHRGGNNPTPTEPDITYKISIVSGNNQTGPLDTQLSQPLKVFVSNDVGVKQIAVVVLFTVTEGHGDLSASAMVTDVDGFCEVTLTPVNVAGTISVQAKVQYTSAAVTFSALGV